MRTRTLLLAGTALAAGLALQSATAQEKGGTLRVAISQMPPAPDPVVTTFGVNWMTATVACEPLFAIDASWTPQPMLAKEFAYSEDGTELTITLRDGLTFQSGAPLTPADVVASLNRFREAAGIGASLKAVTSSIEAKGDNQILIRMPTPTPIVPGLLSVNQSVIMSQASLDGASPAEAVRELDCTGPYRIDSYVPDQGVIFSRWQDYKPAPGPTSGESGEKKAWADTIEFKLMPEPSVRRDSLITGEIDIAMELPTDFYEALKSNPDVEPVIVANNQSLTAVFNTAKGPAADVNLRRAIYWAIEKEPEMLASVGNPDFYTMDGSWIPDPNSFWYTLAGVEDFGPANIEKAKEFLAQSDYDGTPLRWLVASEQYQKHYLTAVTAAQQLEEIGIKVEIIENPMANYIQLRANPDEMDVFSSFLPTYVDPTSIAYLNPSYPGFWTDPTKMELMQKLATTIDPAERKKIFEEVHALIYDQFPFIKYGTESNMYGIRKGVTGNTTTPVGGYSFYNVAPPPKS